MDIKPRLLTLAVAVSGAVVDLAGLIEHRPPGEAIPLEPCPAAGRYPD